MVRLIRLVRVVRVVRMVRIVSWSIVAWSSLLWCGVVCLVWFWSRLVWKVTQDYLDSDHGGLMVTPIYIGELCHAYGRTDGRKVESRARTAKVKFHLDESMKCLRGLLCFFNEKYMNWKKRLLEIAREARCDVTFNFCGKSSKAKGTHHRCTSTNTGWEARQERYLSLD